MLTHKHSATLHIFLKKSCQRFKILKQEQLKAEKIMTRTLTEHAYIIIKYEKIGNNLYMQQERI